MKIWRYIWSVFQYLIMVVGGFFFTVATFIGIPMIFWDRAEPIIANLLASLVVLAFLTGISSGFTLVFPLAFCCGLYCIYEDTRELIVSYRKQPMI